MRIRNGLYRAKNPVTPEQMENGVLYFEAGENIICLDNPEHRLLIRSEFL